MRLTSQVCEPGLRNWFVFSEEPINIYFYDPGFSLSAASSKKKMTTSTSELLFKNKADIDFIVALANSATYKSLSLAVYSETYWEAYDQ